MKSTPTGIDCGPAPSCSASILRGYSVLLRALPYAGSELVEWTGDCTGSVLACSFTLNADTRVTATFRYVGTTASYNLAQNLYIAYYGRPADPAGRAYWAGQADLAGGFDNVVDAFGNSSEYNGRFAGMADNERVTKIYQQTLGRDPDGDGLAWYVKQLNDNKTTLQKIALDVLAGAKSPPDSYTVLNKGTVADYYTAKVVAGCSYGTEQVGVDILKLVTASPATVVAAKSAIDARCGP